MRSYRSFLTVIGLLVLLHVYIGVRLLCALPIGALGCWLAALVLLASCVSMPLGFFARSMRHRALADRVSWVASMMMGWFSSLLVLTLLRDVALGLGFLALRGSVAASMQSWSAAAVPALAALFTLIGLVSARRRARIVTVDVPLKELPPGLEGFTVAQISDVHLGPTIKGDYLDAIVDTVNGMNADLIAVTGDLVDGSVQELAAHAAPLARLKSRHGTYFVTGNHEYYSGERAWTRELERLGLRVLLNEHVVLRHGGAQLVVAGVTDFSAHHFDPARRSDPSAALRGAPAGAPKLLLAHQPRSAPAAAAAGFDLQLSGHTHGGQFWPWNLFVRFQQPFTSGLHRLNDLWVYISRGTGYWGPPNRFGVPSEITRVRLVPAARAAGLMPALRNGIAGPSSAVCVARG